jgi:hypothetical protein
VATIGGAIPISLGLSGTSRTGLGIAVVGGMLTATALTLYVRPSCTRRSRRCGCDAARWRWRRRWPRRPPSSATRGGASRGAHPRQRARDGARAEHRHPDCGGLRRQRAEANHDAVRAAALPSASASTGGVRRERGASRPGQGRGRGGERVRPAGRPARASSLTLTRAARYDALAAQSDRDAVEARSPRSPSASSLQQVPKR